MLGSTIGWKALASAALCVGVAYFGHAQYHYNVVVRRRLGSAQHGIYMPSDVHVVTAFTPRGGKGLELDLDAAVATLLGKASSSGGKVIYVGRVLKLVAASATVPSEDALRFRVLLVTQWPSIEGFEAFRTEALKSPASSWELAWSTPWRRNAAVNLLVPAFLYGLRLKTAVAQQVHDVMTEGTREEFGKVATQGGEWKFDKLLELASSLEREPPTAPVIIWNWLLEHENEEVRANNTRYGLKMMEMLSQSGGGLMEYGWALPASSGALEDEPWRHFENVAAVHYPDVGFFIRMIRSRWMQENVQGKELGDTLALMTVPWGSR